MTNLLRGALGLLVLVAIAIVLSENRRAIQPRVVLSALALQVFIGVLMLFVQRGRTLLDAARRCRLCRQPSHRLRQQGVEFMFGGLVSTRMHEVFGDLGFVFAFRVLPAIIYMSGLIAVLYHLGMMRWIVKILGSVFHRLIGVSRLESFSAVTTIFLGQSEMPVALRPFAEKLKGPELFAVMTSGMAAVAGSTLAGYAGLGVRIDYLLAASLMAVPGGLLLAKLMCPSTEPSTVEFDNLHFEERPSANVIEAAAAGAGLGLRVALNVGAMLIAFIGLIAILAGGFGAVSADLRTPIARYGLRVVAAASLSNLASATIAGTLLG